MLYKSCLTGSRTQVHEQGTTSHHLPMRKWGTGHLTGLKCRWCGSHNWWCSHLPMGKALRMILWLPRVYSISTVMGAEYVMSRKRHWKRIRQLLFHLSGNQSVPTASKAPSLEVWLTLTFDLSVEHLAVPCAASGHWEWWACLSPKGNDASD